MTYICIWYGLNRSEIHRNAPKASGDVGILVKDWITSNYDLSLIDKIIDGILGLKCVDKATGYEFIVYACYLPPENSVRGRDTQGFYSHLLAQIYLHSQCDNLIIAADFNSRIGNLKDVIYDIDSIPLRTVTDNSINQHGRDFIDFLNESKMCVLNGRYKEENSFTSVSRTGSAVVDYMCVPHDV